MSTADMMMDDDDRVRCDDKCGALNHPVTLIEYEAALEHWRYHGYLDGCSHGR